MSIGFIIYLVLGYWAVGQTIYRNKILIGTASNIFIQKLAIGMIFGFILIPIAIILLLINSRR